MNTLLQMYPGDACVFLVANVLVQVTVVILTARLLARLGSRWNAAWRHSIYLVALLCVLASPVLSWMVQATGMTLVTLRPSVPDATPAAPALLPLAHSPAPRLIEPPAPPRVGASTVHREAINIEHGLRPESPSGMSFPDILRCLGVGPWSSGCWAWPCCWRVGVTGCASLPCCGGPPNRSTARR